MSEDLTHQKAMSESDKLALILTAIHRLQEELHERLHGMELIQQRQNSST